MKSEVKKIMDDILAKFKEINAEAGHVIPPRWLDLVYIPKLNPKEQDSFEEAIDYLISENLIEVDSKNNIKLTKKGMDYIYPVNTNELIGKIRKDIMDKFRELNAREGHVIPARWLSLIYYPSLNPKEKEVFSKAIEDLIEEGLIAPARDTIKLTEKGVFTIY